MEMQTITWVQILQVGGLAGVVSALFSALFGGAVKEYFEWRERKRKARHLALKISLILENYYYACRDQINDINDYHTSGGNVGDNSVGLPKLSEYPVDPVAWIYLDQKIADEVLSLPAEIQAIEEGIIFNASLDNMPDGANPDWSLEPLYEMAFRAIGLARSVRLKHGIVGIQRTLDSEYRLEDSRKVFLRKLREREERDRLSLPFI